MSRTRSARPAMRPSAGRLIRSAVRRALSAPRRGAAERPRFDTEAAEVLEDRTLLAAYVVNDTGDVDDGDDANGTTTLREAVNLANADGEDSTITFDASLSGQTITLVNGDLLINDNGTTTTIVGLGDENLTISGNDSSRIFRISADDTAVITGLTLQDGSAGNGGAINVRPGGELTLADVTFINNTATALNNDNGGGALFVDAGGTVTITDQIAAGTIDSDGDDDVDADDGAVTGDVLFTGNTARNGGAIFSAGTLTIEDNADADVIIQGNTVTRAGGGIEVFAGTADLEGVVLDDNRADINGGALHITAGAVNIFEGAFDNVEVTGNSAGQEGGGLWNNGAGVIMNVYGVAGGEGFTGVLIADNTAEGNADGSGDTALLQGGGGIFNNGGTLNVYNGVTISGNSATGAAGAGLTAGSGGGIMSIDGDVSIDETVIIGNSAVRAGGGIEIVEGALTITDDGADAVAGLSELSDNTVGSSPGNGGGLHVTGAVTSDLDFLTVSGNSAANEGGGLWNSATGTMTIGANSPVTLSGNSAPTGGGIFNNGGALTVTDSTLTGNSGADGSGIFSNAGTLDLSDTTVSGDVTYEGDAAANVVTLDGNLTIGGALTLNGNDGDDVFTVGDAGAALGAYTIFANRIALDGGAGEDQLSVYSADLGLLGNNIAILTGGALTGETDTVNVGNVIVRGGGVFVLSPQTGATAEGTLDVTVSNAAVASVIDIRTGSGNDTVLVTGDQPARNNGTSSASRANRVDIRTGAGADDITVENTAIKTSGNNIAIRTGAGDGAMGDTVNVTDCVVFNGGVYIVSESLAAETDNFIVTDTAASTTISLTGGAGDDTLLVQSTAAFDNASGEVPFTRAARIDVRGMAGDDIVDVLNSLVRADGNNIAVRGGDGADEITIEGSASRGTANSNGIYVVGGAGNDTIDGSDSEGNTFSFLGEGGNIDVLTANNIVGNVLYGFGADDDFTVTGSGTFSSAIPIVG